VNKTRNTDLKSDQSASTDKFSITEDKSRITTLENWINYCEYELTYMTTISSQNTDESFEKIDHNPQATNTQITLSQFSTQQFYRLSTDFLYNVFKILQTFSLTKMAGRINEVF